MTDMLADLTTLKRPRLLINAARLGMPDYRRDAHLPRQLGVTQAPRSAESLGQLMEIEQELDADRRARNAGYSPARHVEVLIAMMAEARLLRASESSDPLQSDAC